MKASGRLTQSQAGSLNSMHKNIRPLRQYDENVNINSTDLPPFLELSQWYDASIVASDAGLLISGTLQLCPFMWHRAHFVSPVGGELRQSLSLLGAPSTAATVSFLWHSLLLFM